MLKIFQDENIYVCFICEEMGVDLKAFMLSVVNVATCPYIYIYTV